jgi:hypothetical protein
MVPRTVRTVRVWGYYTAASPQVVDDFTVVLHIEDPDSSLPGPAISTHASVRADRSRTGSTAGGLADELRFTLHLDDPVTLAPGAYWIEVFHRAEGADATFMWSTSGTTPSGEVNAATARQAPGQTWHDTGPLDMAIEVVADFVGVDCNRNQVPDSCDIAAGLLSDSDQDGVADICGPRRPQGRVRP